MFLERCPLCQLFMNQNLFTEPPPLPTPPSPPGWICLVQTIFLCTVKTGVDGFRYLKLRNHCIFWNISIQNIRANYDSDETAFFKLAFIIRARHVRIRPTQYIKNKCMKMELYGCPSTGKFLSVSYNMYSFNVTWDCHVGCTRVE